MIVVGGFDLSLTSSGMVAVPEDWAGDWARIRTGRAGKKLTKAATPEEQIERLRSIRGRVQAFVKANHITVAVIEEYAFSATTIGAHSLGELGGVIKVELFDMGLAVHVVSPARARTLLGKQPKRDRKAWAQGRLYAAGAPKAWSGDELDAFVLANHHLSETGGHAVILPRAA
jgi:Holliday junction resolvasome RuvABC endonuclease subunit